MNTCRFYIDGRWTDAASDARLDVIDPSSGGTIAQVALGNEADADAVVAAAKRAFASWAVSSKHERLALMRRIPSIYRRRQDEMADILDEAGVPVGTFNLVNGDGEGVGTRLSGHADVAMVSFTGSSRAGTLISRNAAGTLERVSLELGGKGANIVFADAADDAVERGVAACFENTGRSCDAPTRRRACSSSAAATPRPSRSPTRPSTA